MDDDVMVARDHRRRSGRRRGHGFTAELAEELAGVEEAVFGIGIQRAAHHRPVAFLELRSRRLQRWRSFALAAQDLVGVAPGKGALSGQHLVEGSAQ